MASAEVLDFAALLAPIPGDDPAGTDPRADPAPASLYQLLKEDRKAAREAEKQAARGETPDGKPVPLADWQPLIDKATRLLAEKSKDVEVVSYLIEALVRKKQFAGLRDGFRLVRALLEGYWDGLFPRGTDFPTVEKRFSHVLQLSGIGREGTLPVSIRKIPFTEKTNAGCFSLADYQLTKPPLEQIAKAVAETPGQFYEDLVGDLRQAQEEFDKFCAVLSEKSGYDAPSSDLRGVLETYLDVVKDLARDKIPKAAVALLTPTDADADGAPAVPGATNAVAPGQPAAARDGAIRGRDDALRRLEQVAAYFRTNEPQSIIPYALDQVIAWGKMPLPQLLAELIPEEEPRRGLFKKVGIKAVES